MWYFFIIPKFPLGLINVYYISKHLFTNVTFYTLTTTVIFKVFIMTGNMAFHAWKGGASLCLTLFMFSSTTYCPLLIPVNISLFVNILENIKFGNRQHGCNEQHSFNTYSSHHPTHWTFYYFSGEHPGCKSFLQILFLSFDRMPYQVV